MGRGFRMSAHARAHMCIHVLGCKENILEVLTVLFYEEWRIGGWKRRLLEVSK